MSTLQKKMVEILGKIILLDGGVFTHKAIFNWAMMKKIAKPDQFVAPSHYNYFQSIITTLKKIGVDKDDTVIVCLEGASWRKDYLGEYKAQRAKAREEQTLIDWPYHYGKINEINEQLENSTNWHFLRIKGMEADDIQAVACKTFSDKECIIVTIDKDLFMLAHFKNTKIFSLNIKYQGSKGVYEKVENPLGILSEKCEKGDVSDNIIVRKDPMKYKVIDTDEDYRLREFIINLIELPKFVSDPIERVLLNLPIKEEHLDKLPFSESLAKRFPQIYLKDKVVTPEQCHKYIEKKKEKTKKKTAEKAKARREKKKLEKLNKENN